MPSHDETSPVAPRSGSVRRQPPARTRSTGGGGGAAGRGSGGRGTPPPPRRSAAGSGRGRTTASRTPGGGSGSGSGGGRPPGGRPPASRPTGAGRPGGRKGKPARTKKQRRRRRLKIALAGILGLFVLLGVFIGVVYASTDVPNPNSVVNAQTTIVYYADGTTEMARLGDENRTNVTLDQVSEPARNAILAAENRSFYSDPGISFSGILRAAWSNVTGGSTQGGSTITQQYVKKAILQDSSQTFGRKFKELFLAIKLDNNYSKDEILQNYLNTIYFGRGASGIEAAANTFFGVHASELTAQQAAVLAVLIRNPSYYDPESHPEDAQDRWGRVLDAMVDEGWLSSADRQASTYPPVAAKAASGLGMPPGPEGLIVTQAIQELESKGYTEQQIRAGGLRITTTVDPAMQSAAVTAVNDVMGGDKPEPENLRQALVAVDPKTGAVKAYYGGTSGTGFDYARSRRPPGSSMKPYVLATALEQGISVDARRDGSNHQTFRDREAPVNNAGGASCPACTLKEAITKSLNTTFYGLAYEVGPDNVRDIALKATGMPETWPDANTPLDGHRTLSSPQTDVTGSSIGIGEYEMQPIDQAVGFATFANGGIHHAPFFVAKVADNTGTVLLQSNGDAGTQAVPPDVANDVSFALEGVAGYSHRSLAGGRPVASKTGTQGKQGSTVDDTDAWMVGYTPSLSAAVWMGSDGQDAIVNAQGKPIYGSGLPGAIWQEFMDTVLKGTPKEPLPNKALIEGDTGEGVPAPVETPARTSEVPVPTQAAPTTSTAPEETQPTDTSPTGSSTNTSTGTSTDAGIPLPGRGGNGGQGPGAGQVVPTG